LNDLFIVNSSALVTCGCHHNKSIPNWPNLA